MGQLVDGVWTEDKDRTVQGHFQRPTTVFRNWITPDGSAGPSGTDGFPAQAGRYHLYVSHACPWAHRTMVFRKLKQLEDVISVSVVSPFMSREGWMFGAPGTADTAIGATRLADVYLQADAKYTGRVSVPVLWDKERRTIVNNESSEIIRMFNSAFAGVTRDRTDYYPEELRREIDEINALVYPNINNRVYRAGSPFENAAV